MIRIGVGGWTFAPWRGRFYPADLPQKRELAYMAERLSAIEINGTFYRSQAPATFAKWRDETPEGFVFALKGPRYATSRRALAEAGESVSRFIASGVAELGDKLGPINWQMPPTKAFDPEDFAAFLALLPRETAGLRLRHAVELRHTSFACAEAVDLARRHGVAIVVAGDSQYPEIADPTTDFVYARIMGTQEGPAAGYDGAALDAWAERARAWARGEAAPGVAVRGEPTALDGPREVFLFVISGHKAANPAAAEALVARLEAK